FLGHLLDRFDLELFGVTLTTHGTSYLGLIMRLGGVYETRGDSELNDGDDVTLYAIVKNSKNKEKNFGVLYGFDNNKGVRNFATKYRWQVPTYFAFYAMIAFAVVFVLGWPATIYLVRFLGITGVEISQITTCAIVEGGLAAAFFLHAAWRMVKCTADPQSWMVMEPATLATRFSKLHK
ncbi:hypothetical protein, partial [Pseudomonas putida]|uniref:hypothetical protein n=1 Tax=Pseudomonas putida TaxID=303 RepID=UPI0018D6E079